jgi:hypothetical protein
MAETAQVIGHGSKLQLGDGATPEVFTDTEGVLSVDFGSNKIDTVDNTDMGAVGTTRTFTEGLEDPGDVTVKINVKPGNVSQAALHAAKGAGIKNFQAVAPGAAFTRAFAGIITSFDLSIPDDKLPTVTVKIKVSGAITETNF